MDGHCQRPGCLPDGAPCSEDAHCASSAGCVQGVCGPPEPDAGPREDADPGSTQDV
ncbi:MAG: hypothetical protein ACQEXJ_11800 [Myxococcota bacterium]